MKKEKPYYGVVYIFENLINGKVYIGQTTTDIENYILSHFYNSQNPASRKLLYKAIRKYHIKNFKIKVLCECYSAKDLNWAEDFYIVEWYNSVDKKFGYNMKSNAFGVNEEVRYKISKTVTSELKVRWANKEYKEKMKKALSVWNSSKERSELSRKTLLKFHSDPIKKNISIEKLKENGKTKEFKEKVSKISKLNWQKEEFKNKRKTSLEKAMLSESYKSKLSLSTKQGWQNLEIRKKRTDGINNYYKIEKNRENKSIESKESWKKILSDPVRKQKQSDNRKMAWEKNPERRIKTAEIRKKLSNRLDFKLLAKVRLYKNNIERFNLILSILKKIKEFNVDFDYLLIRKSNLRKMFNLSEYLVNLFFKTLLNLKYVKFINTKNIKFEKLKKFDTNIIEKEIDVKIQQMQRRIIKCSRIIEKIKNQK